MTIVISLAVAVSQQLSELVQQHPANTQDRFSPSPVLSMQEDSDDDDDDDWEDSEVGELDNNGNPM